MKGGRKKKYLFRGSLSCVDAVSYQHLHISDESIVFISGEECLIMIASSSLSVIYTLPLSTPWPPSFVSSSTRRSPPGHARAQVCPMAKAQDRLLLYDRKSEHAILYGSQS